MLIDLFKVSPANHKPSKEFETKVLDFLKEWFSDSKTVQIQSSGSTGTPKIFDVEKSKMSHSAEMTCNFLELKEGNLALLCLPIEYISGKMMVVRSILRNLKLQIADPTTQPLQNLTEQVDFCAMTPLQVENSLDKIHLIKNLIIGGAAVSESLKKKIFQALQSSATQNRIFETYGMSETFSHIALKEIYPNEEDWFTVFDGVEIALDERGCLEIFAPKLNKEVLHTNDLAEIQGKKQFRFLGRIDNIINSAGAKIFPEELEKIVKQHIANEAVFLGIPDEKWGEKLILVIEGEADENLKSTINRLQFRQSFHKPKEIVFVPQIPRTKNGKVSRPELKKMIASKNF